MSDALPKQRERVVITGRELDWKTLDTIARECGGWIRIGAREGDQAGRNGGLGPRSSGRGRGHRR